MNTICLNYETAKSLFRYDRKTGFIFWKISVSDKIKPGQRAGTKDPKNYSRVRINGKLYLTHRIIWLIVTGKMPVKDIDHINGNKTDNRFKNLRDITKKDNLKNQKISRNNTSGFTGVVWLKIPKKWRAQMTLNKKLIYGGTFETFEAAVKARKTMNRKHGFHKNHGRSK